MLYMRYYTIIIKVETRAVFHILRKKWGDPENI